MAFLRRRRQRLRQQNSAEDTSPHQLLIELYTFWRVSVKYRAQEGVLRNKKSRAFDPAMLFDNRIGIFFFEDIAYKSLLGAIFKNRGLRVERAAI